MNNDERMDQLMAGMAEISTIVESHQYMLTAITASLREMDGRLPDPAKEEEEIQDGETRHAGDRVITAYRLPNGYGNLVVSIDMRSGDSIIEVKNVDYRAKTSLHMKQAPR